MCVSVGAVITLDSLENRKRIVAVHMFAFADDVNYALKVCEILFFSMQFYLFMFGVALSLLNSQNLY